MQQKRPTLIFCFYFAIEGNKKVDAACSQTRSTFHLVIKLIKRLFGWKKVEEKPKTPTIWHI